MSFLVQIRGWELQRGSEKQAKPAPQKATRRRAQKQLREVVRLRNENKLILETADCNWFAHLQFQLHIFYLHIPLTVDNFHTFYYDF